MCHCWYSPRVVKFHCHKERLAQSSRWIITQSEMFQVKGTDKHFSLRLSFHSHTSVVSKSVWWHCYETHGLPLRHSKSHVPTTSSCPNGRCVVNYQFVNKGLQAVILNYIRKLHNFIAARKQWGNASYTNTRRWTAKVSPDTRQTVRRSGS